MSNKFSILLINVCVMLGFIFFLASNNSAFADEHFDLAKHYSPIIYQHVDVDGTHSLGGKSDLIMNFNYDGNWSGNVKWANLEDHTGPATVYYSVIKTTNHWFIYYAIYHPRDWTNKIVQYWPEVMHENDMEAL